MKINDFIYELCINYVDKYSLNERIILEQNKSDLKKLIVIKENKYIDTLGSGIGVEIFLPAVVFIITVISGLIIKDGYELTKKMLKKYLEKRKEKNEYEDLMLDKKNQQKTVTIVINIINMLPDD